MMHSMNGFSAASMCGSVYVRGAGTALPRGMSATLLLGITLAVLLMGLTGVSVAQDYTYTVIANLNDPAPGGGTHVSDFEPGWINNNGEVLFATDLSNALEGLFVNRDGVESEIMRAGQLAPGGGIFGGFGVFSQATMNDGGDVAFSFGLDPFMSPTGKNAGVYRFRRGPGEISAVVVPDVTPAPSGLGPFRGTFFRTWTNNGGTLAFVGYVDDPSGTAGRCCSLKPGIFRASRTNSISKVIVAGDTAPGGGTFDSLRVPSINDNGVIAFGAHVAGEICYGPSGLSCFESVYFKPSGGPIQSIAHQGDLITPGSPDPCGGNFEVAFGPVVNNADPVQIAFIGVRDMTNFGSSTTPHRIKQSAPYLNSGGVTSAALCPGAPMPGGGNFKTASDQTGNIFVNSEGDVAFTAVLDTTSFSSCTTGSNVGKPDTGVYVKQADGTLKVVARTGTVIPGVGTINHAVQFFSPAGLNLPRGSALMNDEGQVVFIAQLQDTTATAPVCSDDPNTVLVVARPVENQQ